MEKVALKVEVEEQRASLVGGGGQDTVRRMEESSLAQWAAIPRLLQTAAHGLSEGIHRPRPLPRVEPHQSGRGQWRH